MITLTNLSHPPIHMEGNTMAFVRSMGVQPADLEGEAGKEGNLRRQLGADA